MRPTTRRLLRRLFETPEARAERIRAHYFREWAQGHMSHAEAQARAEGDIRGDNRFNPGRRPNEGRNDQ